MSRNLVVLASGLVVVVLAGAAGATGIAGEDADRMTICHKQAGQARTMEISRNAWSGHKGHGDHEGACTAAEVNGSGQPGSPRLTTLVALDHEADGSVDGDATFRLVVANEGSNLATGLRLSGALDGDGTWSVRPSAGSVTACTLQQSRLSCDLADLRAGGESVVRLSYDGDLSLCREVGIDLALAASNDVSSGDDRARGSVWVGACSPLDQPGAAAVTSVAPL
jgi:hypothetical protein